MSLTISAVNDAPVCADDASIGDRNQQQTGTIVCADVDDDTLAIAKISGPSHGSASVATNGDWTYTPTVNFSGSDTFTFRANDGSVNSNNATMQLTISATNSAPLCTADSSSGPEDADQTGTVTCSDGDDDEMTYTKVGNPTHGTATVDADGDWTYSPDADYHGSDSFTFRQRRQRELDRGGHVHHRDLGERRSVVRGRHQLGQRRGRPDRHLVLHGRRWRRPQLRQGRRPDDGTATVDTNGDWTYTPTLTSRDPTRSPSAPTTEAWIRTRRRCRSPSTAPTTCRCVVRTSSGIEDADKTGPVACTDVDGDLLTYSKVADPTNGGVTVDTDGQWTYDPDPNFNGVDDFSFRAGDGSAFSSTVTMSITVTAVNDAPSCTADSSSGAEDGDQTGTVTCTDIEGDFLTYDQAGNPANGTAAVDPDGDWTYSPTPTSTAGTTSRSAPTTAT